MWQLMKMPTVFFVGLFILRNKKKLKVQRIFGRVHSGNGMLVVCPICITHRRGDSSGYQLNFRIFICLYKNLKPKCQDK